MAEKSAWALLLALFFFAGPAEVGGAGDCPGRRTEDPVVIEGARLKPLIHENIDRLCVMRYDGRGFRPVPFQVDEKDGDGEYAFPRGDITSKDPDPGLDKNDELVFMAFDCGAKAPAGIKPEGAGKGVELAIIDPVDASRGYVYVFLFEEAAPKSDKDYVSMSLDKDRDRARVEAQSYVIESVQSAVYYNYLALRRPDGALTPDLIDRLKIRGEISAIFGTLKLEFHFDELIKSKITSWIDGPVRVVRRGQGFLKVPGMDIQGGGHSISYFYPSYFIYPMTMDIPVDLKALLTDIHFHGATDFTEAAYGWHYYDAKNPYHEEVVFDGRMSEAEKGMTHEFDHAWCVMTGEQGAFFHRLFFPEEWGLVGKDVYYVDDISLADPPEDDPGLAASGYRFKNFIQLGKGRTTYYMHYYFPVDFEPGDERRIFDVVDRPLEVEARSY